MPRRTAVRVPRRAVVRVPGRAAVLVVAVLVAALGLAACSGGPGPAGPPGATTNPDPHAALTGSVRHDADALRIHYRLRNTGAVPIVVYDGVPGTDSASAPRTDPDAVYVTQRDAHTVEVAKRTFDVPDGVHPDARLLIRGTVLAPGRSLAEDVTVPLPLRARRPYQEAMATPPTLPVRVDRVVFCVGVARQDAFPQRLRSGVPEPSTSESPSVDASPSTGGSAPVGTSPSIAGSPTVGAQPAFPQPSPQHLRCTRPFRY
ncbi:MAG: hypothetical protein WCA46_09065 [Actinocatenispora sp.]